MRNLWKLRKLLEFHRRIAEILEELIVQRKGKEIKMRKNTRGSDDLLNGVMGEKIPQLKA
ncbi:hypothetical protein TorRG33x02_099720 [Trema orientale]|uniref:Uncharacterized protein n=1 Tax=Trema orientale TaxID=63057 RepID=A0A2P5F8Z1_TREOI|nr:hypothetical protein TorRG33x02_099720 [Trema orientale]